MAAPGETLEGIAIPAGHAGLPQMDPHNFPSQWFWLLVTFGLLMMVLKRTALPSIAGGIADRKAAIAGDLAEAEAARKRAQDALSAYETSLAQARAKALALADENRKKTAAEIDKLKAEADAKAHSAAAAAESRIAADRAKAADQVRASAIEAARDIVKRLIGVSVSANEASKFVDQKSS